MSDFFSNIYQGIQQPDVVMNRGPLPPTSSAGMPPGYDGTPDARIDYATTLLGDLDPYAYGEPGRPGTQAAYLNIPHVAQRIVPQINLPEPQPSSSGGGFFGLNHQVDDGDVAFVIRAMFSPFELVDNKGKYNRQGILYAIDPVANLSTVNYILHGLQRFGFDGTGSKNWNALWLALGIDRHFEKLLPRPLGEIMMQLDSEIMKATSETGRLRRCCDAMHFLRRMLCMHIVKDVIKPFGVPRGSEKQGGQHQGIVNKAVTYPVDFVTAMVIDGKVINLVNFWRQFDISAGDDLMMHLETMHATEYVLSHHPKSRRTQAFPPLRKWDVGDLVAKGSGEQIGQYMEDFSHEISSILRSEYGGDGTVAYVARMSGEKGTTPMDVDRGDRPESIFQLVPGVSSSGRAQTRDAVWVQGYWHIARSQVMQFSYDTAVSIANGAHTVASGKLLEVTFEPVWVQPLQTDTSGQSHDVLSFRYDDAPASRKRGPPLESDSMGRRVRVRSSPKDSSFVYTDDGSEDSSSASDAIVEAEGDTESVDDDPGVLRELLGRIKDATARPSENGEGTGGTVTAPPQDEGEGAEQREAENERRKAQVVDGAAERTRLYREKKAREHKELMDEKEAEKQQQYAYEQRIRDERDAAEKKRNKEAAQKERDREAKRQEERAAESKRKAQEAAAEKAAEERAREDAEGASGGGPGGAVDKPVGGVIDSTVKDAAAGGAVGKPAVEPGSATKRDAKKKGQRVQGTDDAKGSGAPAKDIEGKSGDNDRVSEAGQSETSTMPDLKTEERIASLVKALDTKGDLSTDIKELEEYLNANFEALRAPEDPDDGLLILYFLYPCIVWGLRSVGSAIEYAMHKMHHRQQACVIRMIKTNFKGKDQKHIMGHVAYMWLSCSSYLTVYDLSFGYGGMCSIPVEVLATFEDSAKRALGNQDMKNFVPKEYTALLRSICEDLRCAFRVQNHEVFYRDRHEIDQAVNSGSDLDGFLDSYSILNTCAFQILVSSLTENDPKIIDLLVASKEYMRVLSRIEAISFLRFICAARLAQSENLDGDRAKACIKALVDQEDSEWITQVRAYYKIEKPLLQTNVLNPTNSSGTIYDAYQRFSTTLPENKVATASQVSRTTFKKISARNL